MPYQTIDDLPQTIRNQLSVEAQKIYVDSFNKCWKELDKLNPRNHINLPIDEQAHRCAMLEVEFYLHSPPKDKRKTRRH